MCKVVPPPGWAPAPWSGRLPKGFSARTAIAGHGGVATSSADAAGSRPGDDTWATRSSSQSSERSRRSFPSTMPPMQVTAHVSWNRDDAGAGRAAIVAAGRPSHGEQPRRAAPIFEAGVRCTLKGNEMESH